MRITKTIFAAVAVLVSLQAIPAIAYEGSSKEQAACRPDVRRFCSSLKPGADQGMFLSCLQAHRAKLSKACNAVLASHGV
jgi:hypothetical protein